MYSQSFTKINLKKRYSNLIAKYGLSNKINLGEYNPNNRILDRKTLPLAPLNPKSPLAEKIKLNNLHSSFEYYHELFEERAGILEFDAGISKIEANKNAYKEILELWLKNEFKVSGANDFTKSVSQNLPKAEMFLSKINPYKS